MRPVPHNYVVYPSVVPADRSVDVVIVPTEPAFLLTDGEEYTLSFVSVNDDEIDYYDAADRRAQRRLRAEGGVLRLSRCFEGEGEHLMLLHLGERLLGELHLYALREDLMALTPLKGDLHSHSYRSDGKQDPAALAGHFREQGYDFFALTDHNRYYPGGEIDSRYEGVYTGLCRVFGEELHTPGSMVHIVHVGGKQSVAEQYIADEAGYEKRITEIYEPQVPATVPEHLRRRYAMAQWACDRIHEAGGVAIFPHPYWIPGGSRKYNVYDDFAIPLMKSGMFDAYELVGGMGGVGVNRSVALWGELRAEGLKISVVGSSDVHALQKVGDFIDHFTVCFAEANENDAIRDALLAGMCVAVEADGDGYGRQYRCYGSLRLVTYVHFLLKYYFPQMQRLTATLGVTMRNYCMGAADKALIEAQAGAADRYREEFLGRRAPTLPTEALLAWEEKQRERHLQGPLTKGSHLHTTPNRQI